MYCKNCGQEINENAAICVHCGVATDKLTVKQEYKPITGFILSFFIAIAGLIVSIIEYRKAKREGGVSSFALAGIIISSVSMVLTFFLYIIIIGSALSTISLLPLY